jgi:hypothetical protein
MGVILPIDLCKNVVNRPAYLVNMMPFGGVNLSER